MSDDQDLVFMRGGAAGLTVSRSPGEFKLRVEDMDMLRTLLADEKIVGDSLKGPFRVLGPSRRASLHKLLDEWIDGMFG